MVKMASFVMCILMQLQFFKNFKLTLYYEIATWLSAVLFHEDEFEYLAKVNLENYVFSFLNSLSL